MTALVIDGHPDARSLTAALAQRYADAHGGARVLALRDLDFDPHLRFGYRERMLLEPDLADAKRALAEADTVVVAMPLWWGSVPAVLKGFFDRALLPQQEYRYTKLGLPQGLLSARRGRLLLLADTPWFAAPFTGLPAQTQVARNTMRLCGIRSVRTHRMLGVKDASEATIARWLDRAAQLGTKDARAAVASSPRSEPEFAASSRPEASNGQAMAAEAASSSVVATS
ncbi:MULTISPECIES: NAD(P)H-dependent oxidoreductase [unclassified Microbacterium]|uniref:NAD(P)H-dependent oxidoreductase n=1 Tax=unclassified Microbacterium TaxID=2609290 RepID=UPI000EAA76B5|nr:MULTISPECIES: NAD(P)H-dependent oxidoreductase [unclassified Microbacterium]MBT2483708.1 NAD(P)H-dependent oxidoreductase [Microbacterium sp. ISL-108]RKN66705.1 flavodoxin family protein [Microbacterium sp. CGR2]